MGTTVSLIASVVGLVGAGVVWWVRGRKPGTLLPTVAAGVAITSPGSAFAKIAAQVMALASEIPGTDNDKHEFVEDVLRIVREYCAPEETPGTMQEHLTKLMKTAVAELKAVVAPAATTAPPATP